MFRRFVVEQGKTAMSAFDALLIMLIYSLPANSPQCKKRRLFLGLEEFAIKLRKMRILNYCKHGLIKHVLFDG